MAPICSEGCCSQVLGLATMHINERFANPTEKEEAAWIRYNEATAALAAAYGVDPTTLRESLHNYTELTLELLLTRQQPLTSHTEI